MKTKYRPYSFTKNIGGLEQLNRLIKTCYRSGILLSDFSKNVEKEINDRKVLVTDLFICSQSYLGDEFVLEDSLIRESLNRSWSPEVARLYFFSLFLNFPGSDRELKASGLSDFVRNFLYQDEGWLLDRLKLDSVMSWVSENIDLSTKDTIKKYSTNLCYFFEQCDFGVRGKYIDSKPKVWGPIALRLLFERLTSIEPNLSLDDLVLRASEMEVHKLIGVSREFMSDLLPGAAGFYLDKSFEVFNPEHSLPFEGGEYQTPLRREGSYNILVRSGANKNLLAKFYNRKCQICLVPLPETKERDISEAAHIKPLGKPFNGPDNVANMLSLCPNHHRQFDKGSIGIDPKNLEVIAPHGSSPKTLEKLHHVSDHSIDVEFIRFHFENIFKR